MKSFEKEHSLSVAVSVQCTHDEFDDQVVKVMY